MLEASRTRILGLVGDADLVLDVGGWGRPFPRADWVLDLLPYDTRGYYGWDGDPADERFTAATWIERDICAREPWPFEDGAFDFAVCSHTLEDVRDPIWVCSELIRVARAGYVETPSRLEEQTVGVNGPWVGWSHHRWLVDLDDGTLTFAMKPHVVHGRPSMQFPRRFLDVLSPEERVVALWWEDSFDVRELIFTGPGEVDGWLEALVREHAHRVPADAPPGPSRRPLRRSLVRARRAWGSRRG